MRGGIVAARGGFIGELTGAGSGAMSGAAEHRNLDGARGDPRNERSEACGLDETYEMIAQGLLEAAEQDGGSWRMPWHNMIRLPANPATGQPFRGSNVLSAWAAQRRYKFGSPFWASESTWMRLGGAVTRTDRGAWMFKPVFDETSGRMWKPASRMQDGAGPPSKATGPRPKNVGPIGADPEGMMVKSLIGFERGLFFNHGDVKGALLPSAGAPHPFAPLEAAERVTGAYIANRGPALVHGGARAFYDIRTDRIHMPPRESFAPYGGLDGNAYYYCTLLHEEGHSSGSRNRLNRNLKGGFGSKAYAREELVAEIASAFVGARIGLPMTLRESHAHYVASWMTALQGDRRAVLNAVTDAQRVADFLLERTGLPEFQPARDGMRKQDLEGGHA